ncbi:MAG: Rrf2 family transcriptional regulator [Clostridia bacterium]|nr:Rrf2 family transcriptional regulator [Clostridia bacterium]
MRISTKGRYALRMLTDIAQHDAEGCVSLKDVAERLDISKKYLEQLSLGLTQAGLLRGSRGHQGGYRLARSASEIRVGEVLAVMEGSLAPNVCLEENGESLCESCAGCITLPFWRGLDEMIAAYLDACTLQQVLEGRLPRFSVLPPESLTPPGE